MTVVVVVVVVVAVMRSSKMLSKKCTYSQSAFPRQRKIYELKVKRSLVSLICRKIWNGN